MAAAPNPRGAPLLVDQIRKMNPSPHHRILPHANPEKVGSIADSPTMIYRLMACLQSHGNMRAATGAMGNDDSSQQTLKVPDIPWFDFLF